MSSYGQAVVASINPSGKFRARNIKKAKMKISLRQRLRNWILKDDDHELGYEAIRETPSIDSEGMRFTVFKASGGFVIETRTYDRRKDENINSMYVVTENQDLGQELGKIITMESLR